ncbi:MAG TPA: hypothetical protein VH590_17890 [Ktedonobacterales bacterium]|jgi:hypothetical protein
MNGSNTDIRRVFSRVMRRRVEPTAGDRWFNRAFYVALGLLCLGVVLSVTSGIVLWSYLALGVFVAVAVAAVGWRAWDVGRELQAEAAAGVRSEPLTARDTAGCIIFVMGFLLMICVMLIGLFLPRQDAYWVWLAAPLAWFPGALVAALWVAVRGARAR